MSKKLKISNRKSESPWKLNNSNIFGKDFFIRKGEKSKPRNIKLAGIFKLLQITKKIKGDNNDKQPIKFKKEFEIVCEKM